MTVMNYLMLGIGTISGMSTGTQYKGVINMFKELSDEAKLVFIAAVSFAIIIFIGFACNLIEYKLETDRLQWCLAGSKMGMSSPLCGGIYELQKVPSN